MFFELKIYDKKGRLKKTLKPKEVERRSSEKLFNQKSTVTAINRIKDYREQKPLVSQRPRFHDKKCVVCGKKFHPRHAQTKYCSHECQKKSLYLEKKKNPRKSGN